jgi:hypothetical protein
MALIGICGSYGSVNLSLLPYAINNAPSLIVDCANCANPHVLFPFTQPEDMEHVFVVQAELIYKLRDTIKEIPELVKDINPKCIIVTAFDRLFHYDDSEENENVYEHAWELMKKYSKDYDFFVGVSEQKDFARRYCDKILGVEEWGTLCGAKG